MKKNLLFIVPVLFICFLLNPEQKGEWIGEWIKEEGLGSLRIITSENAPFPHHGRSGGLFYKGLYYNAEKHFSSNRVLLFVPEGFKKSTSLKLVYYFHGWFGSIEDSLARFELLNIFAKNLPDALYVFPETARDAPDFFGGRLEDKEGFKKLNREVLELLAAEGIIGLAGNEEIFLAGHSGAFRIIAAILENGGITRRIKAVCLLDALYGRHEVFLKWLAGSEGKLLIVSTREGGTRSSCLAFMKMVTEGSASSRISYRIHKSLPLQAGDPSRVYYIPDDKLGHEEVIKPYLAAFLKHQAGK